MTERTQANGADIPKLGFGTWKLEGEDATRGVTTALKTGYRHIDTAQAYDNEAEVGDGLKQSGLKRDEIFLTTKVWRDNFRDGDLQKSVAESLDKLKTDYVDLLLLHWPVPEVPIQETMKALNELKDEGRVKHIGVSNFTVDLVDEARAHSNAPLAVNQVEYHPYLDQNAVLSACRAAGMAMTAYSPIAQGKVFDDEVITDIAKKHDVSPAQVVLRWLVDQESVVAIPRSSSDDHIKSNFEIAGITLSEEDTGRINALRSSEGRLIDPDWAPDWDK
ncbi:aldo/keto reductase [Oceanicaulis sp. MMSF_3324]|uniref:aldo/keto reductase n=1 Tax=Oceanicaulis sp. MMSF_3324 TaxID=3046702 RepID=UPI00273F85EF|nr:aldo/keto reductase [Oceanicaulis sp. MMSF_3324]